MRFSLLPTMIADSITDLTPQLLEQRGIKLLMLDFDNTIVALTASPTQKNPSQKGFANVLTNTGFRRNAVLWQGIKFIQMCWEPIAPVFNLFW